MLTPGCVHRVSHWVRRKPAVSRGRTPLGHVKLEKRAWSDVSFSLHDSIQPQRVHCRAFKHDSERKATDRDRETRLTLPICKSGVGGFSCWQG